MIVLEILENMGYDGFIEHTKRYQKYIERTNYINLLLLLSLPLLQLLSIYISIPYPCLSLSLPLPRV